MRFLYLFIAAYLTLSVGACASGSGDGAESNPASNAASNNSTDTAIRSFCATVEPDENTRIHLSTGLAQFILQNGSSRNLSRAYWKASKVDIPVIFHVISKGDALEDGEVLDDSLDAQVEVLNRAFSGENGGAVSPFRFRLAGINRVRRPEWHVMEPGSQSELDAKRALHQGGPETLNIYLVTIEGNILGYTLLPVFVPLISDFDGIVMNFRTLPGGSLPRYNTGNVAVHETGHWLGLLHTFSATCDTFVGDLVDDTPVELIPTKGEFCPVERDSCPGNEGIDPVHNHMTYTVDSCRSEFTADQLDFMLFNSLAFRGLQVL